MWKKLSIVTIVLVLGGLLVAPAFADEWHGSGSIHCEGNGVAILRGNGEVELSGQRGMLGFKDLQGDGQIHIQGSGHKRELPGGATFWYGFDGTAQANGSRIVVGLKGKQITLDAVGQGQVRAAGEGFCQVGDQILYWTNEMQTFELAPQE